MPEQSYFYDTNVFQLSQNPTDGDCDRCQQLLDVQKIDWRVVWSELSRTEASLNELLDAIQVAFATNGIDYSEIKLTDARELKKKHRTDETRLRKLRFHGNDFLQLLAATCGECAYIVTRDFDYIDPQLKANRPVKRKKGVDRVERYIKSNFSIGIYLPSEACDALF